MQYIHNPSFNNNFTKRIFNTCPCCAGIRIEDYRRSILPNLNLCHHHRHALIKHNIKKWQLEDQQAQLMKEYKELDKILDPVKNFKRQQKISQIKSQLNEVA